MSDKVLHECGWSSFADAESKEPDSFENNLEEDKSDDGDAIAAENKCMENSRDVVDSVSVRESRRYLPRWIPSLTRSRSSRKKEPVQETRIDLLVKEKSKAERDEIRSESSIAKTIRGIRNKFVDRGLEGKIVVYRVFALITTAVTCEVSMDDEPSYAAHDVDGTGQEDLSGMKYADRRALSMTDTILDSLERRSLAWDGVDFAHEMLLTRGTQFGFNDPIFGTIGFSFTLDISATVKSLLASRKRYELTLKQEEERRLAELAASGGSDSVLGVVSDAAEAVSGVFTSVIGGAIHGTFDYLTRPFMTTRRFSRNVDVNIGAVDGTLSVGGDGDGGGGFEGTTERGEEEGGGNDKDFNPPEGVFSRERIDSLDCTTGSKPSWCA